VLAVVDPGVGGSRRAVVVEASSTGGPRWFVGPDNGLLLGAAERGGAIVRAVELARLDGVGTFDGRDVLAPAAAAICAGTPMTALGAPIDPDGLVRLPPPLLATESDAGGRVTVLRAEVTWVDRFGNVQLAARAVDLAEAPAGPSAVRVTDGGAGGAGSGTVPLRPVAAFSDLARGELGLLVDANGFLALVLNQGSAADRLGLGSGSHIELTW
jgi:S-adenosyl-L-methionine hydrolase (adenosine-forming)